MSSFGRVMQVRNVNEALPLALMQLQASGVQSESRGMRTVRMQGPFVTVYEAPEQRVLFGERRDANPFFHLMDALWMLSGSNRVELPALFLPRIKDFSDNGESFHGAYGYRLRYNYGFDQIGRAESMLRATPDSRQVVLSIWDARVDMGAKTKDMPCNDMVMFDIVDNALNMSVCNRSNDAIWGAYGANAVQFSILQEYLAIRLGVRVGHYAQISNNFHVYEDNPYWLKFNNRDYDSTHVQNPYKGVVTHHPLATDPTDAMLLFKDCVYLSHAVETLGLEAALNIDYGSSFFQQVVDHMLMAWSFRATGDIDKVIRHLTMIEAWDWRKAMLDWVLRRVEAKG